MLHFGMRLVKKKYSLELLRDEFALISTKPSLPILDTLIQQNAYTDELGREYRKEWCLAYRELCLQNYDLNMRYFKLLDSQGFNNALEEFFKKHCKFSEIEDLSRCDKVSGYYVLVLDKYKQAYIGKSEDVKKRIRQHWVVTKPFDRTLLPMGNVKGSCFSIDHFRALDTTRIFVWKRNLRDGLEAEMVKDFPSEYLANRIGGDITNGIEALATLNRRNL